jgi:hypothetical protein
LSSGSSSSASSVPLGARLGGTPTTAHRLAPLARPFAWAALAGQLVFVLAWIVAGALEPGYSHVEQGISELAARDATNPWIVGAGIVVLGLSIAALAPGVLAVLPRRRATVLAAALFAPHSQDEGQRA